MKEKARTAHEQYIRNVSRVSLLAAVLLIAGVTIYLVRQRTRVTPSSTTVVDQLPAVVTPENFENFIGPITQVNARSLAVRMTIVRPGGTHLERDYEVKIDPATTTLSVYHDKATGPEIDPAALADFHTGDQVGVYAQENLYSVTSFTAVKIYKILVQ